MNKPNARFGISSQARPINLPDPTVLESSSHDFAHVFLQTAELLVAQCIFLEQTLINNYNFSQEPVHTIALGLFKKMRVHYYSYALLSEHQDTLGSMFALEHLRRAALGLVYVLTESEADFPKSYLQSVSQQARQLIQVIEHKPEHPNLLRLKNDLEDILVQHPATNEASISLPETVTGLNFLTDPVRALHLGVEPATGLDLALNYRAASPSPNFTELRDAAHLCLHASQVLLEVGAATQSLTPSEEQHLSACFQSFFVWFHEAHQVHSQRSWMR